MYPKTGIFRRLYLQVVGPLQGRGRSNLTEEIKTDMQTSNRVDGEEIV